MNKSYLKNPIFYLVITLSFAHGSAHADTLIDDFLAGLKNRIDSLADVISPPLDRYIDFVDDSTKKVMSLPDKILSASWNLVKKGVRVIVPESNSATKEMTTNEELSAPENTVLLPETETVQGTSMEVPKGLEPLAIRRKKEQQKRIRSLAEPLEANLKNLQQEESQLLGNQQARASELHEYAAQQLAEQSNHSDLSTQHATAQTAHSNLLNQRQAVQEQIDDNMLTPLAKLIYNVQTSPYAWQLGIAAKTGAAATGGYLGHTLYYYFLDHYFAAKKLAPGEVKKLRKKIELDFQTKKVAYDLLLASLEGTTSKAEEQELLDQKAHLEQEFDKIKAQLTALQMHLDPAYQPQQSGLQKAASWASYVTSIVGASYGSYATVLAIGNCSAVNNFYELDGVQGQIPAAENNIAKLRRPLEASHNKLAQIEATIAKKKQEKTVIDEKLLAVLQKKTETQNSLDELLLPTKKERSKEERATVIALQEEQRQKAIQKKKNLELLMQAQPECYQFTEQ